jgi:chromosome segregation ATPase
LNIDKHLWKGSAVVELERFDELEVKIKAIVNQYVQLKKRNEELEELVQRKNGELEEALSRIRALNQEKDSVRTKIDSLLERLEGVEVPQ